MKLSLNQVFIISLLSLTYGSNSGTIRSKTLQKLGSKDLTDNSENSGKENFSAVDASSDYSSSENGEESELNKMGTSNERESKKVGKTDEIQKLINEEKNQTSQTSESFKKNSNNQRDSKGEINKVTGNGNQSTTDTENTRKAPLCSLDNTKDFNITEAKCKEMKNEEAIACSITLSEKKVEEFLKTCSSEILKIPHNTVSILFAILEDNKIQYVDDLFGMANQPVILDKENSSAILQEIVSVIGKDSSTFNVKYVEFVQKFFLNSRFDPDSLSTFLTDIEKLKASPETEVNKQSIKNITIANLIFNLAHTSSNSLSFEMYQKLTGLSDKNLTPQISKLLFDRLNPAITYNSEFNLTFRNIMTFFVVTKSDLEYMLKTVIDLKAEGVVDTKVNGKWTESTYKNFLINLINIYKENRNNEMGNSIYLRENSAKTITLSYFIIALSIILGITVYL
jgi:hypothetical protein